ncbi:MAG: sigma-70 family RNA polymerase sigma factor [Bacteroidia bacterium]|nr:sigma-70 family RNA polymerase sigma factor [Bacteroidia bacterium]
MNGQELIPHLFRTEYRKLVSVLCSHFGIQHMETAEDIVSDTFLSASESWGMKGIPENPVAWLYTVAKNKTRTYLKRNKLFEQKLSPEIRYGSTQSEEPDPDFSERNIEDSQLAMIFAVCDPLVSSESQVALALNLLCGFGAQEIADAFLSNREVIYKRLNRAREKLKEAGIAIAPPTASEIDARLDNVLTTLYLLFSEGYYSVSQNTILRQELCAEAMRLVHLLSENTLTARPSIDALLALMCFHASRFEARSGQNGEIILYDDQDETRWDRELIDHGSYLLERSSTGTVLSKYHLEANIAYWHTHKQDSAEKWENILQLYNRLLQLEYSPMAALNRTYALSKANGKEEAIREAKKLDLDNNHFYFSLLGNLYTDVDNTKALEHFRRALELAHSGAERRLIERNIERLQNI